MASTLPIREIVDYDVFIAGGGALGCTFARYLAPSLKVLVAEAGAQLSQKPGEHLKNSYLYQKDMDAFSSVITGHLQRVSIPFDETYIDTISPASFYPGPFLRNGQNPNQKREDNMAGAFSTYAVGGMITHWTCAIPRHNVDLERKLHVHGEKDYLQDPAEWDRLYNAAERLLCKSTKLFVDSVRQDVVLETLINAYGQHLPQKPTHKRAPHHPLPPVLIGGVAVDANVNKSWKPDPDWDESFLGVQPLPMAGQPVGTGTGLITWTGGDTILGDLCDAPEEVFKILPEHVVKKFVLKAEPNAHGEYEIDYAVVRVLKTAEYIHVRAKYYIAATNSILTPQLLWASGIGTDKGITEHQGPVTDPKKLPVGRYLTEQPMAFCQIILTRDLVAKAEEYLKKKDLPPGAVLAGDPVGLRPNEPPPNVWIPCSMGTYKYYDRQTGEWKTGDRQWHCQVHRDAFSYGAVPPNIDERTVVDLRWFGANRPKFENWIEYQTKYTGEDGSVSDNTDRLGMPQPTIHYKIPEEDIPAMHAMMGDMTFAANALGGYFPGTEPKWMTPGLALHFQGTHRMGLENDGRSVCDNFSRVWLFKNLFVGGNGIIPTATSANPTLTSCALAFKSCEYILQDAIKHNYITKLDHTEFHHRK